MGPDLCLFNVFIDDLELRDKTTWVAVSSIYPKIASMRSWLASTVTHTQQEKSEKIFKEKQICQKHSWRA